MVAVRRPYPGNVTDGTTEGQHEQASADEPAGADATVRPVVVLLGSDERTAELSVALRRLGAEVIVQSPDAATAGAGVAGRLEADYLVPLADAVSAPGLDALGDRTELVPSARSVRLTADREALRRLAADELGLPTAPFWFAGCVEELEAVGAHAGYPLLVKPVTGPIGQGQSVVSGAEDIAAAWQHVVGHDKHHRVLAEAVVEVEVHITLLVVRSEGPSGLAIEFCSPIGHVDADAAVVESWQPQKMSAAAADAARSVAARVVKSLGGRGVFAVELMINGDEVYFSDVTAWPGESAWVTLCSQRLSAFDLQARAILGLPVDTMMISPSACQALKAGPMPTADALSAALGVPESDVRVFGQADAAGRVGIALSTGADLATARERAREVASRLNVGDSRG